MSCTEWLKSFMLPGEEMVSTYVTASAKAAGFTRRDLKEARKALRVKTVRDREDPDVWYWILQQEEGQA